MNPREHKINQREQPRPQRKPLQQALEENGPWTPAKYELADASAMKALQQGTASAEQQRRALEWILRYACALPDWPYRPGANDRDTNIALGRQFVGHQIMKLVQLPLAAMPRSTPNADEHEPQS